MSNFEIGNIVIIKPGTQYDGSYLSNPNWKIGVGIVSGSNCVDWFNNKGQKARNCYNFQRDIMLLSEHEEASEYWKELPELMISTINYNKFIDKIDKSKIYIKSDIKVKNVNDLLYKLLIKENGSNSSNLKTFYRYEGSEYEQCSENRYRSFDDILTICQTYFPSTKIETVFKKLLLLNNTKNNVLNDRLRQRFSYCGDIKRIRYIGNYPSSLYGFYSDAMSRSQGESKYSWKDLFKMININNVEELKEFYLKNLKDEI